MEAQAPAEFTVENIERALHQLYFDPNVSVKDAAQKWLMAAQVSQQAWQFCWVLLQKDKAAEVQFFGANALYIKISHHWAELPADHYANLRTQLFQQILAFAAGPRMVLTRLCVALSAFALNTMPEVWPEAVKGILDTFQQATSTELSPSQRCGALLELLTVLPEQHNTTCLAQSRRGTVRHAMQGGLPYVLPLLQNLLEQQSPLDVQQQALKCFSSWVTFGVPLNEVEGLTNLAFKAVRSPELFDVAIDALVNVVLQPMAYKYPNTVQKFLPQVLQLQDMLETAIKDKDMDTCNGLCRLAVAIGENHSKVLLESTGQHKQNSLELIKIIMMCTGIPGRYPVDETASDMTFSFWYILQDDMIASEPQVFQDHCAYFIPLYMNLVEILLIKVQYPPDAEYSSWTAEEKEQFRCYRQDIADTLVYAFNLLRDSLLNFLYAMLSTILQQDRKQQEETWQPTEGCLHAFLSIGESVDPEECSDQCILNMFNLIPKVPITHVRLAETTLYTIGAYAEWLNSHPELLSGLIPLILSGFTNPDLTLSSTLTLKDVAQECSKNMQPYANDILSACQNALTGNVMKAKDSIRLMHAVGSLLSVLPVQDILNYLHAILGPHVQQLEASLNEQPSASSKATVIQKLNMLSMLFSALDIRRPESEEAEKRQPKPRADEPQPVLLVLQQVYPIVQRLVSQWIADTGVIEAVCEMFKRAVRTLQDEIAPMTAQLSELLVQVYNAIPQSSVLDMAKQLLTLFHSSESHAATMQTLFLQLTSRTVSLFQQGIREHPDLVEGFMSLAGSMLKRCPAVLFQENSNPEALFQCGLMALSFPENHVVKATCVFFAELIGQSASNPLVLQVVTQHGRMLLEVILKAIGGDAPRSVTDNMADILMALNKHCFQLTCTWMGEVMKVEGFPSGLVTAQQKEQFARNVLKERVNKRKMKETVKEFSLLCRGLYGTEYAAETEFEL